MHLHGLGSVIIIAQAKESHSPEQRIVYIRDVIKICIYITLKIENAAFLNTNCYETRASLFYFCPSGPWRLNGNRFHLLCIYYYHSKMG